MSDEDRHASDDRLGASPYGDPRLAGKQPAASRSKTRIGFGIGLVALGVGFFVWTAIKIVQTLAESASGADISVAYTFLIAAALCFSGFALIQRTTVRRDK